MSDAELSPGTVIAEKYSVIEPIGVGGSATVYRAQRVGMAQEVALKVMHSEHPDGDNEKVRFAREAELVMKLKHPHVVPLLDYGHTRTDLPFLVFALLQGESLEQKIRTGGSMAWAQAGRLAVQVLKALEKAHSLGVVHRDIKPANIFICTGVLGDVAQVLDFGLAKMVKEVDTDVTQAGALLGTPRYMAPEQVRGEVITHAADIYSFGLVLAEMLLGRPLVTGAKELDIYVAQGSDKPIFVPDEVLSTPFGNIIQRAVTKQVEVRYHMASQMLADVQAALDNLQGPQEDVEADLDATRMLDPSAAAVLSNMHSEKMRRVLNAAADKKAADLAKKGGVRSSPSKISKAERPTQVPPKHDGAGTVDLGQVDPGPPPPIPAAAFDDEPTASTSNFPGAAQPAMGGHAEAAHAPANADPLGQTVLVPEQGQQFDQPLSSDPRPPMPSGPMSSGPMSSGPMSSGPMSTGPMSTGPMSAGPHAGAPSGPLSGAAPSGPVASGPVGSGPVASGPMISSRSAMPSSVGGAASQPKKSQTGIVVALVFVVLLILAGVAAILWMLGLLPV